MATMSVMTEDPRWVEYGRAAQEVRRGLSATPGAHERYRQALMPFCLLMAELCDSLMRPAMMLALFQNGLPLGVIAAAFRATKEEIACVEDQPPVAPEPADEIERLQRLPYGAYLKTRHWQKVRADALNRAEHGCLLCNAPERLGVHHRTYKRRGCERPADVVVLCPVCHSRHHDALRAVA